MCTRTCTLCSLSTYCPPSVRRRLRSRAQTWSRSASPSSLTSDCTSHDFPQDKEIEWTHALFFRLQTSHARWMRRFLRSSSSDDICSTAETGVFRSPPAADGPIYALSSLLRTRRRGSCPVRSTGCALGCVRRQTDACRLVSYEDKRVSFCARRRRKHDADRRQRHATTSTDGCARTPIACCTGFVYTGYSHYVLHTAMYTAKRLLVQG
jgi:hypothetical protein